MHALVITLVVCSCASCEVSTYCETTEWQNHLVIEIFTHSDNLHSSQHENPVHAGVHGV